MVAGICFLTGLAAAIHVDTDRDVHALLSLIRQNFKFFCEFSRAQMDPSQVFRAD